MFGSAHYRSSVIYDHASRGDGLEPSSAERAIADRLSTGVLELPVLPEVAAKVMRETAKEDWNATVVVDLLRRDPPMAAHLLRLANSVAFRGGSPVVSLQQAVARLGAQNLRQLAVVIACETKVFQVPGFEAEVRQIFRHSLATGLIAKEISRARRTNVEEAFLTGLLHDVGWPLVLQIAVELKVAGEREPLLRSLQAHHALVARKLAAQWQLPERVGRALEEHHFTDHEGPSAEAAATLALADTLIWTAENKRTDRADVVRQHPAVAILNLYPDVVTALLEAAPRLVDEAGAS